MASIYSNCYVNIVATGAADSSKGCLAPRNPLHRPIPLFAKGLLQPETEDKSIFLRAVEEFSRLRLSHETDRLSALLGIAKVFHARLMSTYLRGLWGGDLARRLLWDVTKYENVHTNASPFNSPLKRQNREVALTWSWASMVMIEGIGIIFPAAHDASFSKNPQFYPSKHASPPAKSPGTSSFETLLETKTICVNTEHFFATVSLPETEKNKMLVFDTDVEDMILFYV
ncbi:hypothetical protein EAF00_008428 [Botryotinia globosa]|nr:hypothetical protein EAF00_008428 [Botryotinia globosa]